MGDSVEPARVFCNWQPSQLDATTIAIEFGRLLVRLGVTPAKEPNRHDGLWLPRSPHENWELAHDEKSDTIGWHRDAHEGYYPVEIVLWSNTLAVEIINCEHEPFFVSAGDVVLLLNQRSWHRLPPAVRECRNRWSMRVWCKDV